MNFPDPVISMAIEPRTRVDQDRLGQVLQRMTEDDPTLKVSKNPETGQTIIAGMGELHLEVVRDAAGVTSEAEIRFGNYLEYGRRLLRLVAGLSRAAAGEVLWQGEDIRELLADEIQRDYAADDQLHLVSVLKGGFIFLGDLVRAMARPVTIDFMAVSSYAKGTTSSGEVRVLKLVDAVDAAGFARHGKQGVRPLSTRELQALKKLGYTGN